MSLIETINVQDQSMVVRYEPGISSLEDWVDMAVKAEIRRFQNEQAWQADRPYDVSRWGYPSLQIGLITDNGGLITWQLLRGDAQPAFNSTNSRLGVGDSTTAASATQTDLQAATNKFRKLVDSASPTFPRVTGESGGPSNTREILFRTTFASTEANFDWREFGVFNASSGGTMLDRFISTQGTKASGQVWELSITLRIT